MRGITSSLRPGFAKHWRTIEPYDYVRTAVGLLLLTAAALKIHQLLFDPASLAIQGGLFASKWTVIAVVQAELLLSVFLLLNFCSRATWTATFMVFSAFAGYSAMKVVTGVRCACFGAVAVHTHPIVPLLIDWVHSRFAVRKTACF